MRDEKQIAAKLKDAKTCIPSTKNHCKPQPRLSLSKKKPFSCPSTRHGSLPRPAVLLCEHTYAHLSSAVHVHALSKPSQRRWEISQELGRHFLQTLIFFATWAHVKSSSTANYPTAQSTCFSPARSRKSGLSAARGVCTNTAYFPSHYRKRDLAAAAVIQLDAYLRRLVIGKLRFRLH